MMTNKPRNANDEDLIDGIVVDQPIDQPTSMSYCLHRIRLGELCREITDNVPFATSSTGGPAFQQAQEIDIKLRAFSNEVPAFFSLGTDLSQVPVNDLRRSPEIVSQRYILNSLLHTQRCRLHLPFLSQNSADRANTYSRTACLDAARMVIRAEAQLRKEKFPFVLSRLKFSGVLHCMCMAIVVLLLDLCLNKSTRPAEDQERRGEIFDAFGILEEAKSDSPFAKHLLDSFMTILRRNKVSLPEMENTNTDRLGVENCESASRPTDGSDMPTGPSSIDLNADTALTDSSQPFFGDFWQTFDTNIDANTFDWDTLFSELESSLLSA